MPEVHHTGCNCGAIRLTMNGRPKRVGLCHCQTCRKATGSAFLANAVWDARNVSITGTTTAWKATAFTRHFCPTCGSPVFGMEDDDQAEIDVPLGTIEDAPSPFTPSYELWVGRREHWLCPVEGAAQHDRNRSA